MTSDRTSLHSPLPAPCIVDAGTVVNKQDMRRLLCDLGPVCYRYSQGEHCISEGEGYVVEVFSDPNEATLVTNHSIYLNVCSFDYLELTRIPRVSVPNFQGSGSSSSGKEPTQEPDCPSLFPASESSSGNKTAPPPDRLPTLPPHVACLSLIQEGTQLQLIPLSDPLKARRDRSINTVALEAVVADMLSANLDLNEDEDHFPF